MDILNQFAAFAAILGAVLLVLWLAGVWISWAWQDLWGEVYTPPRERLLIAMAWPWDLLRRR